MSPARSAAGVCYPLHEDPELAEAIDVERRDVTASALAAREIDLPRGPWTDRPRAMGAGFGLLVLEGVLVRRIGVDARYSAEIVGEGDVLRPPDGELPSPLTLTTSWMVLEPTRLAVLDERFVRQLAQYPGLGACLFARAVQRTRQLAVNMAIVHHARVDVRLHLLLWHLAGRWGRVRADGTVVPLRLTHATLAELVAARRPTVTSALSELTRAGLVRSIDEGWLLSGDPPGVLPVPGSSSPDARRRPGPPEARR